MIVFDIETSPLSKDELAEHLAFKPPAHPGEFDESRVKLGNLKDKAKIAEKVAAAKQDHEWAVANHAAATAAAEKAAWDELEGRAALSPITGRIVVIGYYSTDKNVTVLDAADDYELGEAAICANFWRRYDQCRREKRKLVGHNSIGFDVPFIIRRSWLLGVDVPGTILDRGRYIDSLVFTDTMQLWSCGGRDFAKLDALAKAFKCGGKPDGVDGSMFAAMWVADRKQAEDYLRNDLMMTAKVAERMGLL